MGILLRFVPGLGTDFPINDGGMFLSMIRDLQASHFALPAFTSYNLSNIPFAYPPLGMYLAALLSTVLPVADIELVRWLPAIGSATIVPVFYWMALQLFRDNHKAFISVTLVAFLPDSFSWLVMGGGLSRSFGVLFFITSIGFVIRVFRDHDGSSIWFSVLFCGLAVLSHPEVGLQTAGICFLVWLLYGRNRDGVKNALVISIGTLLVTSPWWLTVLLHHGVTPFTSAMQTGIRETLLASLFHSFFSLQGSFPIMPILSLLGTYVCLRENDWLPIGWGFLPFLIDPRNAPAIATYGFVLLATEALFYISSQMNRLASEGKLGKNVKTAGFVTVAGFVLLIGYLFFDTYRGAVDLSRVSLSEADRDTMAWIESNLPADSRFLLLTNTGQISPMTDAYQEWFPSLTERRSLNTLQGTEWTLGAVFYPYSLALMDLQACKDTACVYDWMSVQNLQADYLVVRPHRVSEELLVSIEMDEDLSDVYRSETVLIYEMEK